MRKIANYNDQKMQEEQFNVLAAILSEIRIFQRTKKFLKVLLTDSERSAVSQRLDILRMKNKGFKYSEIENKLKTTRNTITKAIYHYEKNVNNQKNFDDIITRFKFDKNKFREEIKTTYPNQGKIEISTGGVRQLLRNKRKRRKY